MANKWRGLNDVNDISYKINVNYLNDVNDVNDVNGVGKCVDFIGKWIAMRPKAFWLNILRLSYGKTHLLKPR